MKRRYDMMLRCWQDDLGARPTFFDLRDQLKAMETLHKVKFLHSVILWGIIIKYVELFTYKIFNNIEGIMINSVTMCLYSSSSCLISQPSTSEDFV